MQGDDCAADIIHSTLRPFAFIAHVFADGGYASDKLVAALADQPVDLEIDRRIDKERGFKAVRRRWVVERTFAWLCCNRRLMAHCEALAVIDDGFAKLAIIYIMLQQLTERTPTPRNMNFRVRLLIRPNGDFSIVPLCGLCLSVWKNSPRLPSGCYLSIIFQAPIFPWMTSFPGCPGRRSM